MPNTLNKFAGEPGFALEESGDAVLRLRSNDQARAAWRRVSLQYAAAQLRRLGYTGAAKALEDDASRRFGKGTGEHEVIR